MKWTTLLACGTIVVITTTAGAEEPQVTADAPPPPAVRGTVTIDAPGALIPPNLTHAVVYLDAHPALDEPHLDEHGEPLPPPPIEQRPQIIQKNKAFVPDFAVVPIYTWMEFPNWDDFSHNVFSRSKAAPPFDLDRYPYGESKCYQYSKLGIVQIFCNIHPSMRATVVVVPNKYFARADAEGRFAIRGVPDGEYVLVASHLRSKEQRQKIVVKDGVAEPVSFTLEQNLSEILADTKRDRRHDTGVMRGLGAKKEQLNLPVITETHAACCPDANHASHEADREAAD